MRLSVTANWRPDETIKILRAKIQQLIFDVGHHIKI